MQDKYYICICSPLTTILPLRKTDFIPCITSPSTFYYIWFNELLIMLNAYLYWGNGNKFHGWLISISLSWFYTSLSLYFLTFPYSYLAILLTVMLAVIISNCNKQLTLSYADSKRRICKCIHCYYSFSLPILNHLKSNGQMEKLITFIHYLLM